MSSRNCNLRFPKLLTFVHFGPPCHIFVIPPPPPLPFLLHQFGILSYKSHNYRIVNMNRLISSKISSLKYIISVRKDIRSKFILKRHLLLCMWYLRHNNEVSKASLIHWTFVCFTVKLLCNDVMSFFVWKMTYCLNFYFKRKNDV